MFNLHGHAKSIVSIIILCFSMGSVLPAWATVNSVAETSPPTTIIIGIAPGVDGATRDIVINGIKEIVMKADHGTEFRIVDALLQRQIVSFQAPRGRSIRLKYRAYSKDQTKIKKYIDDPQAVRAGRGIQIHLPGFLDYIAASVRTDGGGNTRCIIYGSMLFQSEDEPDASFGKGCVPSDFHIDASSRVSPFGSSDKDGTLDGLYFDMCTLGERFGSVDQAKITRFWSLVISSRGAVLATVTPYADLVNERALNGATDAAMNVETDKASTVLEILCGNAASSSTSIPVPEPVFVPAPQSKPVQASQPVKVYTPPVSEPLTPTKMSVDCLMAWDGSHSMSSVLPLLGESATSIADMGSRLTMGYSFGAVVYRLKTTTSIFELSLFERSSNDQPSKGMQGWKLFTDVARLGLYDRDGKSQTINHIDGINTLVDVEFGINASLRMLKNGTGQRKVLIIAGDRGHVELDGELGGFSEEDKKACQRIESMVRDFAENQSDFRIVALFTGDPNGDEVERESSAFFKRLAAIAGDRGVYSESVFGLESIVAKAILED